MAVLPDGTQVAGKAWFEVDDAARRIDCGSEGPSDYRGWLVLTGEDPSTVEVHVSTAETEDEQVGRDIETTLENIMRLVESGEGVARP